MSATPHQQRRRPYVEAFGLNYAHPWKMLDLDLLDQLDACADDMARRLLLGKSEKFTPGEAPDIPPNPASAR